MTVATAAMPPAASRTDRAVDVLVVDDNPDHRGLMVRVLRAAGHQVITAGTAEDALQQLASTTVDVVLIDQRLPTMSGAELLATVVDLPDAPASVVVTGAGSEQLVVEALRLGAVDYVVKSPTYLAGLPAVVARADRQRELARRYRELQRLALLVHQPMARADTVEQILTGARRLLGAHGVLLARRDDDRGWVVAARSGEVGDIPGLLDWLQRREHGRPGGRGTDLVVDLPVEPGEAPGALVIAPEPDAPFLDEEVQLAGTYAGFAASALRQVRRLELERGLVHQLQQAVRVRQDFLASVSHELRTPLTVITGYVETLLRRPESLATPDLHAHLLERVLGNAGELARLIDQLLDVASLEGGRELRTVLHEVDLREVVGEVTEELEFHLDGRPGRRELRSTLVLADPSLLRRTLVNLVSNACKYSAPDAPVEIRMHPVGPHVRVEVVDAGIGVGAADRDRVFEPFWRGPEAVAEAIRGTGIGLALVREYVDTMGGSVGVDPAPGSGSIFWFTVPAVPDRGVGDKIT